MNTLELNAFAHGITMFIRNKTDNPNEAISMLGFALIMIYDQVADNDKTFETFAEEFKKGMIASRNDRMQGTGTAQ